MIFLFVGLSFALFGVQAALKRTDGLAYLIVGFYAFPLYLLTAFSAPGYAPPSLAVDGSLANLARVGLHGLAFFLLLGVIVLGRRGRLRVPQAALPAFASCAWLLVIALLADSGAETASRGVLSLLVVLSFFVLLPSAINNPERFVLHMGRASVMLALVMAGLAVLTIWQFGNFPAWSMRFGRPLNPNVLGYLVLLAFISSGFTPTSWFVRGLLGAILLATGSRAAMGLAVLFGLFLFVRNRRTWRQVAFVAVPAALLGVAVVYYIPELLDRGEQVLYKRSSLTSGRFEAWTDAAKVIQTNPLLGVGERFHLEEVGESDREMRMHNLYLEMAASYGIPMAVFSLILYGMLLFGTRKAVRRAEMAQTSRIAVEFYVLSVAVTPLVSTVSWLNLGDGGSVLSLAMILPLIAWLGSRKSVRRPEIVPSTELMNGRTLHV